jgi:hypothetical protein
VVPLEEPAPIDGSVVHCEELVSPAIDEEDWEMLRR